MDNRKYFEFVAGIMFELDETSRRFKEASDLIQEEYEADQKATLSADVEPFAQKCKAIGINPRNHIMKFKGAVISVSDAYGKKHSIQFGEAIPKKRPQRRGSGSNYYDLGSQKTPAMMKTRI